MRSLRRVEFTDRVRCHASQLGASDVTAFRLLRRQHTATRRGADRGCGERGGAYAHRHRRTRSRAWWRPGRWLGRARRRRSRHRQVDFAAADARCDRRAHEEPIRQRRGVAGADCVACAAPGVATGSVALPGRNLRRAHCGKCAKRRPTRARHRFDPDDLDRVADGGTGLGEPGARIGSAAGALCQGNGHEHLPRRPRDEGGRHRRAARARTHGRCRALLRRRAGQPFPVCCAHSRTASARSTNSACLQ